MDFDEECGQARGATVHARLGRGRSYYRRVNIIDTTCLVARRRGFALAFTRLTRYANHRVFDFPIFFFTCLFFSFPPFPGDSAVYRFRAKPFDHLLTVERDAKRAR